MLEVLSFIGADCDTDHYLVVAEVRERFNLRKLSELEVRKQYQIKISKSSAALEPLKDSEDTNMGWENIKQNI